MTEVERLKQAIAALESQRAVLGDAVVEAALAPMREKLAALVQASAQDLRGERKLVTVMFADLSGFTALCEKMDPEAVRDLMNACFERLVPIVEKYNGTVDKFLGDEVMALFGAPVAHENDPEQAIRAALEMVDALAAINAERGIDLGLHFGINTGLVIAGGLGTHQRQEYSVMGDAVNLASRLEDVSQRGEILVGPDTYRLAAPLFEFEALAPVQVKGKAELVSVYRVLAPKTVAGKARGIVGLDSPLVGRRAEFQALFDAVNHLQGGAGGIVTIIGEAGLGKSRLVAELRKQVQETGELGVQWVEGRCLLQGSSTAYLWLDVLRKLLGVRPETPPTAIRDALEEQVRSLCPERFEDVYPYLARLMSLRFEPGEELSGATEAEAALHSLEGESFKRGAFRAIECLLEGATHKRPLLIVCEDLHWADPISIELLEYLLPLTDSAALLFVCTFRPEAELDCWRIKEAAMQHHPDRYADLRLDPLFPAESGTLVGNLLCEQPASASEPESAVFRQFKERIIGCAEGNPFYVEEIIRSLIDSGVLVRNEATGRWKVARAVTDIAIPDTLHGVLMARIDRLPKEAKRVLQIAAVLGRIFSCRVLAAIAREERELDRHLQTLRQEQMIREWLLEPEVEYIFKHHLTQEAAYNSLLKKEQRVFHQRAAEALEQLYPDRIEEQVELLAYHWERAGEWTKAITYLLRAGDRARRLGASLSAVDFYQSALRKAEGLVPESPTSLLQIHERLGDIYLENLSRPDEALEHYRSFLARAKLGEDVARGMRKVADVHMLRGDLVEAQRYYGTALSYLNSLASPVAETSRVHAKLAYLLLSKNQLEIATQHANASFEISGQIADARGLADASRVMSLIVAFRGDLGAACEHDKRSLELYRELGDLPRITQACNNLGDSYRLLGQLDRALEYLNEGLQVARRIGDMRDEALLLQTIAELYLDQGQWELAIAYLEQALPLAEKSGQASRKIEVHLILGSAYESVGQLEKARHHLEIAEAQSRDTQQLRFAPRIYLDLARLNAVQAEYDKAHECLRLAEDAAGQEPPDVFLGLKHRCYGYLYGCRGNWDGAVEHLETSLRFLERANLPAEVGKAHLSLGTAYASRGKESDRGRACEELIAALSTFRRLQASGYLAQVEAQLEEIGYQPSSIDIWSGQDAPQAG